MVRNLLQCARPQVDPWVRRSAGEGNGCTTPVFLPGEFHGQRSLVGYSPCGHTESDVTEQLHTQDLGHSAVVIVTGHPVQ